MDENKEINLIEIPDLHISIVRDRLSDYDNDPKIALDFNEVIDRLRV